MFKCSDCDQEFKSRAGLAGHRQFKHSSSSSSKAAPSSSKAALTPILRGAKSASVQAWGWRRGMPMGNFIDTVVFNYFKEHGVVLEEDGSWRAIEE